MRADFPVLNWLASVLRRRLLLGLLGGLAGLLLLAWLGLPVLLRWGIEKQGSDALGRVIQVEQVSFNPLRLAARLNGLRMLESDGRSAFFSLEQLELNLSLSSLWHRAVVLDALRASGGDLQVIREDEKRFNFTELIERFAAPAEAEPGEPLRFSLNNIELSRMRVLLDDRVLGEQHRVEDLHLALPFVSNLPARVETYVQPRVAARIDGSAFELLGEVKPFSGRRELSLQLDVAQLELTRYLAYLPVDLPLKIKQGRVSSKLRLSWTEADAQQAAKLSLAGQVGVHELVLKDAAKAHLFDLKTLALEVKQIDLLSQPLVVHLGRVELDAPELSISRDKAGKLNLARVLPTSGKKEKPQAGRVESPRFMLDELQVKGASVHWKDEAVPGGFALELNALDLRLQDLDLAADKPAALKLSARSGKDMTLAVEARIGVKAGRHSGHIALAGLQLEPLRPYYAAALDRVLFRGKADALADFSVEPGPKGPAVRLERVALELDAFSMESLVSRQPLLQVPQTRIEGLSVDLEKRLVHVERFQNKGSQAKILRGKGGEFELVSLFKAHSAANEKAKEVLLDKVEQVAQAVEAAAPPDETDLPWQLSVGEIKLDALGAQIEDRSGSSVVAMHLHDFSLSVQDWRNQPGHKARIKLAGRVNRQGQLALHGDLAGQPLQGQLQLDLRKLDVLSAQPYVEALYRLILTRGNITAKGRLEFDFSGKEPDLQYQGSFSADDFSAFDRLNDTDFMRWKRLALSDARFKLRPLSFSARLLSVDGLYSRLILDEQGQLNVREMAVKAPKQAQTPAELPARTESTKPLQLDIQRIDLRGADIGYVDRFIKPGFKADLMAVNGSLSGFSSDPAALARLELKGRLDGIAPVNVSGALNPFRTDGLLDIQAQVRDVDLSSASTYAGRYVGYGISKGKLSMDVQYEVRERKLSAQNSLRLDQLTFGEAVESPAATSLPVLLAVSLLKDRNGVIDLNLPISGSLDDPQFSVGGVVLKMLVNLIGKAITSPFALLGAVFGDEAETYSWLEFAPGSAHIAAEGERKMSALAKVLRERPGLKLEIAALADPAVDLAGFQRQRLIARLQVLKLESLLKSGQIPEGEIKLDGSAQEYARLLQQLYEREPLESRPRNAFGLLRKLSVAEMEQVLLRSFVVDSEDLHDLMRSRALSARTYLLETEKIEAERVFLLAAAPAEKAGEQARVVFSLR